MNINFTENIQLTLSSYFSVYFEIGLIVFAFFILIITLFLAYKRLNHSVRFTVVALLNVLSFCALIGLISDVKIKTNNEFSAILLTSGISQQQIDSLPVDDKTRVFVLSTRSSSAFWQSTLDLSHLKNAPILIDNATEIFLFQPLLSQLNVYGDGLLPQQWQMFHALSDKDETIKNQEIVYNNRVNIDFFPSKIRTGPIMLDWPKQLVLGQPFYIKGKFRSAIKDKELIYTITLSDLHDEMVDELVIKNNESFNLSASIKNQGLFTYQLKVFDDDQQLVLAEPVAFTVTSSTQIKVVIKQSSASFESKHFKNWLAEQGEEVLVLTQISKDNYIQQRVNSAAYQSSNTENERNPKIINKALVVSWLKHFSLLYMDSRAFSALNEKEINQLDIAIKQGLGLIILVNDELFSSSTKILKNSLLNHLFVGAALPKNTENGRTISTVPRWPQSQIESAISYKQVKLPITNGKILIKGSEGQALWVNYAYGLGNIAFSLIDSSYEWLISGEKMHYSQYWQTIIKQVSRQKQSSGWHNAPKDKIYFQRQAQKLCAQLNKNDVGNLKTKQINLIVSPMIESAYCGAYWSNMVGWHTLTLENNKNNSPVNIQSLFLYAPHHWLTWQQNLKHEASYLASESLSNTHLTTIYIKINKTKFWWLLFISLSLLWFERKLF